MPKARKKKEARASSVPLPLTFGLGTATPEVGLLRSIEELEEEPLLALDKEGEIPHQDEPAHSVPYMEDDDETDDRHLQHDPPLTPDFTSFGGLQSIPKAGHQDGETLIPTLANDNNEDFRDLESNLEFPPLLGFHNPLPHSDLRLAVPASQIADSGMKSLPDLSKTTITNESEMHDSRQQVHSLSSDIPSSSTRIPSQQDDQNKPMNNDRTKSQWSNLFANNRKPLKDFMLKKPQHGPASSVAAKQQIWRPKQRPKNTTFIRVPSKNGPLTKASTSGVQNIHETRDDPECTTTPSASAQLATTADPPVPGNLDQSDSTLDTSSTLHHDDQHNAQLVPLQPALLSTSHSIDVEGFKQVLSKRHQRNLRSQKNPEHHADRPKDKDII
ncbi:hypothetical protein Dimus_002982 [Dionaea muscipula]